MLKVSTTKQSDRSSRRAAKLRLGAAAFLRFMRDTAKWTTTVENRLAKLYIAIREDSIHVYAIARMERYDFELSRLLSEFVIVQADLGIQANGHIVPDGPEEELGAFFDPNEAFLITVV